jgi:hypothetical protein
MRNIDLEPLPDRKIREMAMRDWMDTLSGLWLAYGRKIDQQQLMAYANYLSWLPLGLLERAVEKAILESSSYVPTAGSIMRAVAIDLGVEPNIDDLKAAAEAWCERSWQRVVGHQFEEDENG